MDFFQILSEIEKVDADVYDRFDTRRAVFKNLSGMGKKITAATLPVVLSTMFTKAYGQTTGTLSQLIVDTLNLALSLEYLERYFYQAGIDRGLFTGNDLNAITIIRDDEVGHINALRMVLGSAAIADPTAAAFDYTAGGKLNPFGSAALFLGNAQAFVDTGVRAYKGGAVNLMANKAILTAALNIHSVEARHSSHIRTMRRGLNGAGLAVAGLDGGGGAGSPTPKSWVSLQEGGGPAPAVTAPVYGAGNPATTFPAEDNVTQATLNVQSGTTAPTGLTITAAAASEAFDEPLDATTVKTIARNFRSATAPAYLFA
jgi:hypothetical protein